MGDDVIANAQPVRLLDTQDNPYGVESNPLVVQFNGSVGVVQVTGTVPVTIPEPVEVNGTVAISTNPVPVSFTQPVEVTLNGTQNVVLREQPVQVTGTVTANLGSNGTITLGGQPILVTTVQNQGRFHGWSTQASVGIFPCRPSTYTPQAAGAQRSVNSTSANDTAAGTGARTIKITYYTQTGTGTLAGPFYETVTLNGTTGVNTVATNIRYISEIEVLTAGTGGVNAGAIQVWTGLGATGTIWASIPVGNYDQGSAHFYVCSGCVFDLADIMVATSAAAANFPGFIVRYRPLDDANAAERNLIPDIRAHLYNPVTHSLQAQARVNGPAIVTVYYRVVNSTSQTGYVDVGYSQSAA